jgi:GDP-L-fucose synthase
MELSRRAPTFVAGHRGLTRDHAELDLTDAAATAAFFDQVRPTYVFVAAAKVGGILANSTYPADFIRINLQIQTNVLSAAYDAGVEKLLFLGSSCIYPKHAPQPMKEEHLLTGPLEPTNTPYAIAKIAGLTMCESYNRQYGTRFIAAMPTNLYGPGDNFDPETSHVLPAMIRRLHEAKLTGAPFVTMWGSGKPQREFLYVDDLADACVFLMEKFEPGNGPVFANVGVGEDLTIAELAATVAGVVGYGGEIRWDTSKPDGTPRKLLDVSVLSNLGWTAKTPLEDGIRTTYAAYLEQMP